MRPRSLLVVFLAGGYATAPARAQDEPVARFVVDAPPNCPDASDVRDMVTARLGRDPFREEAEHTVSVSVSADARGVHGALELVGADSGVLGTRVLDVSPGRCAELMEALAVAISVALDPATGLIGTARNEDLPSTPNVAVAHDEHPPALVSDLRSSALTRSTVPTAPADARVLGIAVSGSVAVGRTIDPAAGGALGLRLHFDVFTVGLEATIHAQLASTNAAGASISMMQVGVTLLGCVAVLGLIELCVPVHVGMLDARSAGTATDPAQSAVAYAGARLGVDLSPLHALRVTPWAEVAVGVVSTEVSVDGVPIWQSPLATGLFGLSVELIP